MNPPGGDPIEIFLVEDNPGDVEFFRRGLGASRYERSEVPLQLGRAGPGVADQPRGVRRLQLAGAAGTRVYPAGRT